MIPTQARVGKKVRVRGDRRRPELRGTVELRGGRKRVFWHHEPEEIRGGTR